MSARLLPLPPLPALDEEQAGLLARLVRDLDRDGLWWLSGYAAALAQSRNGVAAATRAEAEAVDAARLSIVFGSQTGNARRVAEQLAQDAGAAGLAVRLLRADAYPLRELANERLLYLVVSTQGDGEPSDDARALVDFLAGRRAPALPQLRYAVLGLGDSSYPRFNAIGRQLDTRLAELGAQRLFEAGAADVDVETVATPWRARAIELARTSLPATAARASVTPLRPASTSTAATREHPYPAELLQNQRISGRGSRRDVRHLELSLAGPGLLYEPGDALGVRHRNPSRLVEAVLAATGLAPTLEVEYSGERRALRDWLQMQRELTRLSRPFLVAHAARAQASELERALAPAGADALAALLASHQLVDVLRRWPAAWSGADLVAALRPLVPRLYSIASSRAVVGDEAHLTLDVLGYEAHGEPHIGAASSYLAALAEGDSVPVYLEPNERFRLPADPGRDIVMIGAGTGVAPFRGFVQQRAAAGARGRNWLFFGNPHFRSDFLYQVEWQQARRDGRLQRIDLAFSRDGLGIVDANGEVPATRTYVQHRLGERAAEVLDWIEGGAHLYVCGSVAMGRDVHAALRAIVAARRGLDAEAAEEVLRELQQQGRYARDVY